MNQPIPQFVSFVPVPCMCNGVITGKAEGSQAYNVAIDRSPLGVGGVIRVTPIYQAGIGPTYKKDDKVKVLAVFHFDVNNNKFDSDAKQYQGHILGLYDPEAVIESDIQNPLSEKRDDRVVMRNEVSQAGIAATDNYELIATPGGSVSQTMKAFGAGIYKNSHYIKAQNYHRIVSHNDPDYQAREHFGMYMGSDSNDEATRVLETDFPILYRRFVPQTRDPSKWVSTCEGAYAPWMGANNNNEVVAFGKEVLFTKIVNNDKSRVTAEMGEPGTDFISMRVDDVMTGELSAPTDAGATPGVVGNKFKISVSDKGAVEIHAAGKGTPATNLVGFKMSISEDGELKIQSAKKITITHGDTDEGTNSISLDPTGGMIIHAKTGFKVNDKKLVNEGIIDWLIQNLPTLYTSASPGSPCVVNPAAVALLNINANAPDEFGGYKTASLPTPVLATITQPDNRMTIA